MQFFGKSNSVLIFTLLSLACTACGIHKTKTSAESANISSLAHDPNAQISYAEVNQSIIASSCVSCHRSSSAAGGVALDSYANLSANITAVEAAIQAGSMPRGSSLSADQKTLIAKWISEGHPEFSNAPPTTPSPSATDTPVSVPSNPPIALPAITYAEVNQAVFQASCVSCHNSTAPADGIALDTYAGVAANIAGVRTAISSGSMPLFGTVTDANKTLVANWIGQGFPERATGNPTNPAPTAAATPVPTPTPTPAPTEASILVLIRNHFDQSVKPLVQRACMDCHNANAVPEGILGHTPIARSIEWNHIHEASKILDFSLTFPNCSSASSDPTYYLTELRGAIQGGGMPPNYFKIFHKHDGKVLSSTENQVILDWIQESLTALSSVVSTSPPSALSYFSRNCLSCHNSDHAAGGFSFQGSGTELSIPKGKASDGTPFLTNHDPLHSAIYLVLLGDASLRHKLPEMPLGGSASSADQQLIFNWIQSNN